MMRSRQLAACIVGAGPRGLAVLERLCANARGLSSATRILVHVVDPCPAGAGRVWRTWQSNQLLMNTVSSQVTLFTDESVEMDGVLEPGPSLYEWARFLTLMRQSAGYDDNIVAEARELGPDSYPSRAFYGHYLEWVFQRIVNTAPPQVSVVIHRSRATVLEDAPGPLGAVPSGAPSGGHSGAYRRLRAGGTRRQRVLLEDGTRLDDLDAVVITVGHVPADATPEEAGLAEFAARHDLTYLPPGNPADADLSGIRAGSAVALRGLGLNFFDHMALLTLGRGGSFERRSGRLVYLPSGQEPRLYAGSRRGVPYHARGENQKGPHGRHIPVVLTPAVIAELQARSRAGSGLDFRRDLWPLIAKEVETVYYATLLVARDCQCTAGRFQDEYLGHPWGSAAERGTIEAFGLADAVWDWDRIAFPHAGREFTALADFRSWLLGYLRRDLAEAQDGNVGSPLKAALDVLRDLRNEIRLLVDHGGLAGRSHARDLDRWYTPLNAYLSIGPPARRIEEMIALIEAGVLDVLGPDMQVRPDSGASCFVAESAVPGTRVPVTGLIEARLPDIDMRRTADPLLRHLRDTGQCRWHSIADPDGTVHETGGLAVTERPYHLIDATGTAHPRRFVLGVPTESVHWVTAAGIRPGVNSVTLADADAMALTVLSLTTDLPQAADQPLGSDSREEGPAMQIGA
jgi:uncharacterized NAD(P)/FAD-binding protein YdhS